MYADLSATRIRATTACPFPHRRRSVSDLWENAIIVSIAMSASAYGRIPGIEGDVDMDIQYLTHPAD